MALAALMESRGPELWPVDRRRGTFGPEQVVGPYQSIRSADHTMIRNPGRESPGFRFFCNDPGPQMAQMTQIARMAKGPQMAQMTQITRMAKGPQMAQLIDALQKGPSAVQAPSALSVTSTSSVDVFRERCLLSARRKG